MSAFVESMSALRRGCIDSSSESAFWRCTSIRLSTRTACSVVEAELRAELVAEPLVEDRAGAVRRRRNVGAARSAPAWRDAGTQAAARRARSPLLPDRRRETPAPAPPPRSRCSFGIRSSSISLLHGDHQFLDGRGLSRRHPCGHGRGGSRARRRVRWRRRFRARGCRIPARRVRARIRPRRRRGSGGATRPGARPDPRAASAGQDRRGALDDPPNHRLPAPPRPATGRAGPRSDPDRRSFADLLSVSHRQPLAQRSPGLVQVVADRALGHPQPRGDLRVPPSLDTRGGARSRGGYRPAAPSASSRSLPQNRARSVSRPGSVPPPLRSARLDRSFRVPRTRSRSGSG